MPEKPTGPVIFANQSSKRDFLVKTLKKKKHLKTYFACFSKSFAEKLVEIGSLL